MMGRNQKPQLIARVLVIFVASCLVLPLANAGESGGNEWKVKSGDTLYAIARAIYPGNASKQASLRKDIMKLNPSVFANGANNMKVGEVLKLPDYAVAKSAQPEAGVTLPRPVPGKVTPKPGLPSVSTVKFGGTEWEVRSGDTLYGICRTIFPGDGRKQAQLGRDIKKLNPSIFAGGANNMKSGVVLKMPDYVSPKSIPPKGEQEAVPVPETEPVPEKVTPKSAPQPVIPPSDVEPQPETLTVKEKPSSLGAKGNVIVGLGYSYGGDKLVVVTGGPDIYAGSGINVRLGYEQMFQHGSGYRASLGLKYYTLLSDTSVSLRDVYLKLAYQYRATPVLYGIGAVYDAGANLESNGSAKFDAAFGPVLYFEGVGGGMLSGWGLSATALTIKEKTSRKSFNASRVEVYYRWRF